ncbi:hypothetical protein D3C77_345850 [compost metagenome]
MLAQRAPQVTDHATLSSEHIGERAHAAGQGGVIEQLCALAGLPAELIKVGSLLQEHLLGLSQQLLSLGQGILHFRGLLTGLQLGFQPIEGANALAVHAFEALQSCQIRLQSLGFDQRLARQIEQSVQAFGRHPQDSLTAFSGAFAGTRRGDFGLDFRQYWLE